eukprot:Rmarinus@m.8967
MSSTRRNRPSRSRVGWTTATCLTNRQSRTQPQQAQKLKSTSVDIKQPPYALASSEMSSPRVLRQPRKRKTRTRLRAWFEITFVRNVTAYKSGWKKCKENSKWRMSTCPSKIPSVQICNMRQRQHNSGLNFSRRP